MARSANDARRSLLPGAATLVLVTILLIILLRVENQKAIIALLALSVGAVIAANRLGLLKPVAHSFSEREDMLGLLAIVAMLAIGAVFHEDHFVLLLVCTVVLYTVATLGLSIQFGYAGVLNFAGASFFGIGAYTAAVLNQHTAIPHLLVLLIGGLMAALVGSLLLLPVLRTRGHYAALVTIAFALLFKTFLEVSEVLGGPQGIQVRGMTILGWSFNDNIEIGGVELSFYLNYFIMSMIIVVLAFVLVRRLERSWIGLNLDALRLDETAAGCFGLNIVRWKITAFLLGNFLIGVAGTLHGMVVGFVQPNNYTFADSLVLVSILLLGGIGNPWGVAVATVIVVIVPEKLQVIQEYRFLLYAALVVVVLLFRPEGLLPRPVRRYFPGWQP
ncbi:ABC transporter permease [Bradyrhizobium sp. NAS80.1]|uniref:branched-chain amino acid ABC transporter permease n=1 Tax=Bradyrhizobium sp. NAS80.1 TaxID=1680159 RepID=UPI000962C8C4|nr:branched-chain amino acid ABC transporter permease [Bradyrhizobium sp. NAS80.1]OKO89759.1 ABC transporter permease [Bradyrhizobium sp. NAS80.1]